MALTQPDGPSPYVSIYIARKQANEIERLLVASKSKTAMAALKVVRKAIARNA